MHEAQQRPQPQPRQPAQKIMRFGFSVAALVCGQCSPASFASASGKKRPLVAPLHPLGGFVAQSHHGSQQAPPPDSPKTQARGTYGGHGAACWGAMGGCKRRGTKQLPTTIFKMDKMNPTLQWSHK